MSNTATVFPVWETGVTKDEILELLLTIYDVSSNCLRNLAKVILRMIRGKKIRKKDLLRLSFSALEIIFCYFSCPFPGLSFFLEELAKKLRKKMGW